MDVQISRPVSRLKDPSRRYLQLIDLQRARLRQLLLQDEGLPTNLVTQPQQLGVLALSDSGNSPLHQLSPSNPVFLSGSGFLPPQVPHWPQHKLTHQGLSPLTV